MMDVNIRLSANCTNSGKAIRKSSIRNLHSEVGLTVDKTPQNGDVY